MPRETGREICQNGVVGVGYLPSREGSYTQSYTRKVQVLLVFSLPGVGNVVFFQKLFLEENRSLCPFMNLFSALANSNVGNDTFV